MPWPTDFPGSTKADLTGGWSTWLGRRWRQTEHVRSECDDRGASTVDTGEHFAGPLTRRQWIWILLAAAAASFLAKALLAWKTRPRLFDQCGASILLFLFLASGFGIQYLYWLIPWAVVLGYHATILLYLTSGVFMFAVYNYWAGGIPWWFANSNHKGWSGWFHLPQILTWGSIGLLVIWFWLSFLISEEREPDVYTANGRGK